MMNMTQFVKYLQDAARLNGQDTALAKVLQGQTFVPGTTTSKRMYAYQNGIETDWQRAVLRDGLQRNMQAGLNGATADTRFSLSGNYFEQQGMIPGQANTRGTGIRLDRTQRRAASALAPAHSCRVRSSKWASGRAPSVTPRR